MGNKRRDVLTKWEQTALDEFLTWHKDIVAVRLNKNVTAVKEKEIWYIMEVSQEVTI